MSRVIRLPSTIQLAPGARRIVAVEGRSIALFNIAGTLYAIDDNCPHHGASLCYGRLVDHTIQCAAHGLRFNVKTGSMPAGGLTAETFPVECVEGIIAITLPEKEGD